MARLGNLCPVRMKTYMALGGILLVTPNRRAKHCPKQNFAKLRNASSFPHAKLSATAWAP